MKNAFKSTGNREDCMEESISKLEHRHLEMVQVGQERRYFKNDEILWALSNSFRQGNILVMGIPEEKRGRKEQRVYLKK